jgi:hypothetical protein
MAGRRLDEEILTVVCPVAERFGPVVRLACSLLPLSTKHSCKRSVSTVRTRVPHSGQPISCVSTGTWMFFASHSGSGQMRLEYARLISEGRLSALEAPPLP